MASRDEFECVMKEVDAELKAADVPIHARPFRALGPVANRLRVKGDIPLVTVAVDPDDFSAAALGCQVHAWYEKRYGDRLKIHPGPGSVLVDIRGDAWEMRLPLCYGTAILVCDPSALGQTQRRSPHGRGVLYNVLNGIVDMTSELAGSLTDQEQQQILAHIARSMKILEDVRSASASLFIKEARSDLAESVRCFMDRRAYGQSMWASLQFTEKLMKSRLASGGVAFRKVHDLAGLNKLVTALGPTICKSDLDEIQCSAGVRYGEISVDRDSALRAHLAALRVAGGLGFSANAAGRSS